MRTALVPFNPTIGDLDGNARRAADAVASAGARGAELVVFPELALTGYPPRDLLRRPAFVRRTREVLDALAATLGPIPTLIGAPIAEDGHLYNSLVLIENGAVVQRYDKRLLPTYDVFDERRYFKPGTSAGVMTIAGTRVGIAICEDLWRAHDAPGAAGYRDLPDPIEELAAARPDVLICPSASPFVLGKGVLQREILAQAARRTGAITLSLNQLGGNDDLLFDGAVSVATPNGTVVSGPRGDASVLHVDTADPQAWAAATPHNAPTDEAHDDPDELGALWTMLTLGVRDYARKTGFSGAVLGLSGGIDSALVATIAAAALGPGAVTAVAMPSRYSSEGSLTDARELARRTGLRLVEIPLAGVHAAMESELEGVYEELGLPRTSGVAEENIQARLRGTLVMAISNKAGLLPLATGNKSELAVGYCTLYGDMNGGLAPIADLTKTRVFALSRWVNEHRPGFDSPPIPEPIMTKPPSAELRPDQTDQDSLPPYDTLDAILDLLIDGVSSISTAAAELGVPEPTVRSIAGLISRSEYKRKQLTTGLKVTRWAFGTGRRIPIAKLAEIQ